MINISLSLDLSGCVQGVQGVQGALCRVKASIHAACAGCAGFTLHVCAHAQRFIINFYTSFTPCTPCTHCTTIDLIRFFDFLCLHTAMHMSLYPAHLKNIRGFDQIMDKKRQQWETIKNTAPVLADFLSQVSSAFGKPVWVGVDLAGGERIDIGVCGVGMGLNQNKSVGVDRIDQRIEQLIDGAGGLVDGISSLLSKYRLYDGVIILDQLRQLSKADAVVIYRDVFYFNVGFERLPELIQLVAFDMAVDLGIKNAINVLQTAFNKLSVGQIYVDGVLGSATLRSAKYVCNVYRVDVLRVICNTRKAFYRADYFLHA